MFCFLVEILAKIIMEGEVGGGVVPHNFATLLRSLHMVLVARDFKCQTGRIVWTVDSMQLYSYC